MLGCRGHPKPTFLLDIELSLVLQRVLSDDRIASAFDLVSVLNSSMSECPLLDENAWNRGCLLDPINHEALEYVWSELKRLGMTQETTRDRDWAEMMSNAKRPRCDNDTLEYAEVPDAQ